MKMTLATLLLSLTTVLASAQSITLQEVLAQTHTRTAVINAELELSDAREARERSQADPLALRPDKLQAEQRLTLAERALEQARLDAVAELAGSYTQLLEAEAQRDLAQQGEALSAQAVEIAEIRLERGSGTELDVRNARTALQEAREGVRAAQEGVALARSNLASLSNLDEDELSDVAPIPEEMLVRLPHRQTVLSSLGRQPQLLEARQGRELAAVGLDVLDPSYAPRVQIENAELQLRQTEELVREAERGLELQLRSLYNQAESARERYQVEQQAYANAQEELAFAERRFEAGLIAEIELRERELQTAQAELAVLQAKHAYLGALLELQAATLNPLLELEEADAN